MKKSDLKTGMIVTTRMGERYVVLRDTLLEGVEKDILISLGIRIPGSWMPLSSYNEDMECFYDEDDNLFEYENEYPFKDFDIVIVEQPLNAAAITANISSFRKTIWTRGA